MITDTYPHRVARLRESPRWMEPTVDDDDDVMVLGSRIISTVDAVGRLACALHESPSDEKYQELADRCPSRAMMSSMLRILDGIADFIGDVDAGSLIEIGMDVAKDAVCRDVLASLDEEDHDSIWGDWTDEQQA